MSNITGRAGQSHTTGCCSCAKTREQQNRQRQKTDVSDALFSIAQLTELGQRTQPITHLLQGNKEAKTRKSLLVSLYKNTPSCRLKCQIDDIKKQQHVIKQQLYQTLQVLNSVLLIYNNIYKN